MEENQEHQTQPHESFAHRHHHSAESIITLFEWLLVAFILALVFQGFGVQAFQIPTGSMAETLRGAHYQFRCIRCGYEFDTGNGGFSLDRPQCPNCNYFQPPSAFGPLKNGDRIFVLKCIYQFFDPKRWDVVVFKNPTNPRDNFIKRLVALPGETVQLINGDLYIDGKIMRKPLNVQRELWMPIFVQDFQPMAAEQHFNTLIEEGKDQVNTIWRQPFKNERNSIWDLQPGRYVLRDQSGRRHVMAFQPDNSNEFRATYAYNSSAGYAYRPVCSDLMITFYAEGQNPDGYIGASLEKFGVIYSAQVNFSGSLTFTKTVNGTTTPLGRPMLTGRIETGVYEKFEFANVDQQLVLRWGDKRFSYNLAADPSFRGGDAQNEETPSVKIFAAGSAQLCHIGLYRDIFYIGEGEALRATADNPFTLGTDQFFVCGDNCNDSSDARLWSVKGIGNNGKTYRTGTVPREYMMGKAVMVYWSQAFRPAPKSPPMIPNLGNIKIIYGGSEQLY
jgi:signal peptidase I